MIGCPFGRRGNRRGAERSFCASPGSCSCPAGSLLAPGQQIRAARLHLPGIAHTLQARLGAKARALYRAGDVLRLEETEVDVHGMAPPVVQVPYLRAGMK